MSQCMLYGAIYYRTPFELREYMFSLEAKMANRARAHASYSLEQRPHHHDKLRFKMAKYCILVKCGHVTLLLDAFCISFALKL